MIPRIWRKFFQFGKVHSVPVLHGSLIIHLLLFFRLFVVRFAKITPSKTKDRTLNRKRSVVCVRNNPHSAPFRKAKLVKAIAVSVLIPEVWQLIIRHSVRLII